MPGLWDMLFPREEAPQTPATVSPLIRSMMGDDPRLHAATTQAGQVGRDAGDAARQYLRDVLSGQYARQGMEQLTGGYQWNPDLSAHENALAASRDPHSLDQAMNVAMGVGPGAIRAYHGSPHDFAKFDASKIGTGEGVQAYGHGLYFAGNEGVARAYRDALGGQPTIGGNSIFDNATAWGGIKQRQLASSAINDAIASGARGDDAVHVAMKSLSDIGNGISDDFTRQPYYDATNSLFQLIGKKWETPPGRMYEVNIHADPEGFLNWDKPLREHSNAVQEALGWTPKLRAEYDATTNSVDDAILGALRGDADPALVDSISRRANEINRSVGVRRDATGSDIVKGNSIFDRASDANRSAALLDRGIPGVRYLDQGSRAAGDGTSNYVVFDPRIIEIVRKYGIAGLLGGAGAVGATEATAAP